MRGQAHTLEAVTAAMLLLSSVVFALGVTAVTPLSGSTSNQHIQNQQAAMAEGILSTAVANDTLVPTLLFWNATGGEFHGASDDGYQNGGPPTAFGATLNETLGSRGIAFDVSVYYLRTTDRRARIPLVNLGSPSDNAATASVTVPVYDDDRLRDAAGDPTGTTLAETSDYFASDVSPDTPLYNVLEVEVVVWRM